MNNELSPLQVEELISDCLSCIDAAIRAVRINSIPDLSLLMYSRAAMKALQTSGDETLDYFQVYQDMLESGKPVTTL
jgi:hypothetical protein